MIKLNKTQLQDRINFINNYINASNASTGSKFDANANIVSKNVATLSAEINKDIDIQICRHLIYEELIELYGEDIANKYIEQLDNHEIYSHDESHPFKPYCVSCDMYPFLENGLTDFGGEAKAPKHLCSYNGGYINLVFALASQFAGAIATPQFLTFFDYFAKKDFGENYLETHSKEVEQELQSSWYALNQPASARNYQSPFTNLAVFDENYFNSLFSNFIYPDGTKPKWESINKLQKFFMRWFNKERTKALLTFPVLNVSLLNNGKTVVDREYAEFIAQEISEGNSFFIYTSDTVDSLASCCRLRNAIDINDFSYSLGAGGIKTGSISVTTLNMNRFIQNVVNSESYNEKKHLPIIKEELRKQIKLIHKYLLAFKSLFIKLQDKGMLPAYDAGYISLDKQYLTVGVNGFVEAAEYCGYIPNNNKEYKNFVSSLLETISLTNKETCEDIPGLKLNTEFVPGEGLGVKFAKWDKKDGYVVNRDCYNSYMYPVEDESISILDKFELHGNSTTQYLDGGSALHLNLESSPTKETVLKLLDVAVQTGCNYFCFNVKTTICDDCGNIDKRTLQECPKCGSKNIGYATRVIGYLRRVDNFSKDRQLEEGYRYYHKGEI